jgi:uncharacterized membrane protein (DUF106 family)
MDPEMKKLLEENLRLSQENNTMLHKMRRSMIISRALTVFYWIIIIGSAFGAYYFIQPYIDQILGVDGGDKSNLESFGDMFNKFKGSSPE